MLLFSNGAKILCFIHVARAVDGKDAGLRNGEKNKPPIGSRLYLFTVAFAKLLEHIPYSNFVIFDLPNISLIVLFETLLFS